MCLDARAFPGSGKLLLQMMVICCTITTVTAKVLNVSHKPKIQKKKKSFPIPFVACCCPLVFVADPSSTHPHTHTSPTQSCCRSAVPSWGVHDVLEWRARFWLHGSTNQHDCLRNEVHCLLIWSLGSRICGGPLRPSCLQRQRPERTALPLSRQCHTRCEHCPPLRIDCHQHGAVDSDIQQIFFPGFRRYCDPLKHLSPRAFHQRGGCPIRPEQQLHLAFPRQNQRKPWVFSRSTDHGYSMRLRVV